jgi:hypothetical protein
MKSAGGNEQSNVQRALQQEVNLRVAKSDRSVTNASSSTAMEMVGTRIPFDLVGYSQRTR